MTYRQLLRDPRWQKKRLTIFERDHWTCQRCGETTRELQVHHHAYVGAPWEAPDHLLQTLCVDCHTAVSSDASATPSITMNQGDEALYARLKAIHPGFAEEWRKVQRTLERHHQEEESLYARFLALHERFFDTPQKHTGDTT